MIAIRVSNNQVEIDDRVYHSFNVRENLGKMLEDILKTCLYAEESIVLYTEGGDVIREWICPQVSNHYKVWNKEGDM
jgi:hypothetical protein